MFKHSIEPILQQEVGTNLSERRRKVSRGDSSWVYGVTIVDYKNHKARFALMFAGVRSRGELNGFIA